MFETHLQTDMCVFPLCQDTYQQTNQQAKVCKPTQNSNPLRLFKMYGFIIHSIWPRKLLGILCKAESHLFDVSIDIPFSLLLPLITRLPQTHPQRLNRLLYVSPTLIHNTNTHMAHSNILGRNLFMQTSCKNNTLLQQIRQ